MTYFTELFGALGVVTPLLFYAIGFIAVLITAVSKSGFGGAVALGIPVLILVTSPRVALAVTLPILLIIDIWVVFFSNNKINYKLLFIMLIFGLIGAWPWLVFFRLHIQRCACHLYWQHVSIDSFFIFQKTVSARQNRPRSHPSSAKQANSALELGRLLVHNFRHCQLYFSFRRHPFADISIILQGTKDCFHRLSRCVFLYIESHQSSPLLGT